MPRRDRTARREAERHGRRAETIAALYLNLKGYRLVERRFRAPVGEIDLIMRRGRTLIFVEVKARRDIEAGLSAVSGAAQRRILRAAEAFIASYPAAADMECRFDVVAVAPRHWPRHLPDAFSFDR